MRRGILVFSNVRYAFAFDIRGESFSVRVRGQSTPETTPGSSHAAVSGSKAFYFYLRGLLTYRIRGSVDLESGTLAFLEELPRGRRFPRALVCVHVGRAA